MARDIHDHYFHQAKRDGYRSRAAYKLIEIDDRKSIIAEDDAILDCGCAPGSWLQVAAGRVGPKGVVVGVDKKPVEGGFREENIVTLEGDLTKMDAADLLAPVRAVKGPHAIFNVILSDMAPFTTGDRTIDHHKSIRLVHAVLDLCDGLLRPARGGARAASGGDSGGDSGGGSGGNVVAKVFEGGAYPDLVVRARSMFAAVKGFKPKASRDESKEIYIIARGYKGKSGPMEDQAGEEMPEGFELPKRKPSTGWGS